MKDKFVNIGLINKGRMAPFVKAIFRKKKLKFYQKEGVGICLVKFKDILT